jgi:hypothetical protein
MLISEGHEFSFRKQPATMTVLRNDGYCWGRIETADGQRFDVSTGKDWYDYDDESAAEGFVRASRRSSNVDPVDGGAA